MAWITVPANNLKIGTNTLKLWGTDSISGSIQKIRVTRSVEAGELKDAFGIDGALVGDGLSGLNVTSAIAAERSSKQIIDDMASDKILSPSEKTTWRDSWVSIDASYLKAVAYAESLIVDTTAIVTAHDTLYTLLTDLGVWSLPDTNFPLQFLANPNIMQETYGTYSTAYRELSDNCTNAVALLAEETAIELAGDYTEGWSEEGADVTGNNTAADTANVGGTPAGTVITDLGTAHFNAVAANTAVIAMASDNKLSVDEKTTWRRQWEYILDNFVIYTAKANRLEVSINPVTIAKDNLYFYLGVNGVWSNPDTANTISGTSLIAVTSAYYAALEQFLEDCLVKEGQDARAAAATASNDIFEDNLLGLLTDGSAQEIAAARGQVVISGGFINADLIETQAIVVGDITDFENGVQTIIDENPAPAGDGPTAVSWKWPYNSTLINGNMIGTGSILANSIATNSLTADKIAAGAITADKIEAGAITSAKIAAGALYADHIEGDITKSVAFSLWDQNVAIPENGLYTTGSISYTLAASPIPPAGGAQLKRIPHLTVCLQMHNDGPLGSGRIRVTLSASGKTSYINEYHFLVYGAGTATAIATADWATENQITAKIEVMNFNGGAMVLDNLSGALFGLR